jgi:hypothetical protein
VDGYSGAADTFLEESSPDAEHGGDGSLNVDADDPGGSGLDLQTLLRFDEIFGSGSGQIASSDEILTARLVLQVTNPGDPLSVHRMLGDWLEASTWSSFGVDGVQADDAEVLSLAEALTAAPAVGVLSIDVTESVRAWQADPSANRGWVLLPTGGNGVDFDSAEGGVPPRLEVVVDVTESTTRLELFDEAGGLLAEGVEDALNVDRLIGNFRTGGAVQSMRTVWPR